MRSFDDLAKLYIYRDKLAKLVVQNDSYGAIFLRVEEMIVMLEAEQAAHDAKDVLARARVIASRHKAMV